MFNSCISTPIQVDFSFEVEYENDDLSKLKTTACSNEEKSQEIFKNLEILIEISHDNINSNKDFVYLSQNFDDFENKLTIAKLRRDLIQSINLKEPRNLQKGVAKFSFKKLAFYEP